MKSKKITILDGAMGTMLAPHLESGQLPESFNILAPEKVREIHENYIAAGAEIVYANTFGANRYKFGAELKEIIARGVSIARSAAGNKAKVAMSVGPLGALLEPLGKITYGEAYGAYSEIMRFGAEAGAELAAIETMSDLLECKAAVLAARDAGLSVFATMSFDRNGMAFAGCSAESMAVTLTALGAEAIGLNCSTGPYEMIPVAGKILKNTHLPVIVKANAGLPNVSGGYGLTPEEFALAYKTLTDMGVTLIGGCCGTTPEYIKKLSELKNNYHLRVTEYVPSVSSHSAAVKLDRFRTIGERINPTGKKLLKQALIERNYGYILEQAISQTVAGAEILDVNCGISEIDEKKVLPEIVLNIQSVCDAPLQLDSADAEALESALKAYRGRPIVNSVNADDKVLDKILPLVKRYSALVVGLTLSEKGIPATAEERLALAEYIIKRTEEYGIRREDVIIDPLTLTLGAEQAQAQETLKAVRELSRRGIKTLLGISNVSYGLPERELLTRTFLAAALANGLSAAIINPNSEAMNETVAAFRVINGDDAGAKAFSERSLLAKREPAVSDTIEKCVLNGLKDECAALVKNKLDAGAKPLELVGELTSTLDEVGRRYEGGKLFLPGLLASAEAARAGFEVLRSAMPEGAGDKGKIILATVRGDIHDIGKNIVKVILSNYGYKIIDLGKSVDSETIIACAKKDGVRLIGLSALMTTTVKNMEEIIRDIRASGHRCKIMVGGAVLTEEYAQIIGADYYAKDANDAVKIAKQFFR